MYVQRCLGDGQDIPIVGVDLLSLLLNQTLSHNGRLHLPEDIILMLSKCSQKKPEIQKMVLPQPHKPEHDVDHYLSQGSERFAFGITDDSFQIPIATTTRDSMTSIVGDNPGPQVP